MNLATLAQSQTLATLLQALAPTTGLVAGKTVEARLLALAGDGTATAQLGSETIELVLAGPTARQAALQPGATLVLTFEAATEPGTSLKATLVDIRPPAATPVPATTTPAQNAATSAPSVPTPGSPASFATQPSTLRAGAVPPSGAEPAGQPGAPTAASASSLATAARVQAGPLLGPALARQDSLAPLLANLRALSQGSLAVTIPKPLAVLVEGILAQAIPAERRPLTAQGLKTAIATSGLFLEARQAQGAAPAPGTDLKAGLQALRTALAPLVQALSLPETSRSAAADKAPAGIGLPLPTLDPSARATPPRRDGPLIAQPIAEPSLMAGEKPLAIVETLLDQTDAALDRITLSQYASLPAEAARTEAQQSQRWLTELPLAFANGVTMLPLQIEKEPPRRESDGTAGPLWRVRFALDVEPMGPLQGVVTLQGRSVGITLWAEREDTSKLLRSASPGLEAALLDAQFEHGAIEIHTGQPRVAQPMAGQFLDRMS
ncbi:hypothetical protein IP69_08115 [Bosea sp. AAP35]|uniref:flagellar hook-length control protein FliK n=1 Tax=Bosea sp. AAP35 TaxID=1523417 RepID=UPI0006B8A989|nr:flagellar hook-length control protein FliK [Bosea sp. AAP35]KPF71035.1 hypothetical protein IP69_08115 [Bosea sp. AAP35]